MTLFPVETRSRGRLAIALRPRGGDWLEDELRSLVDSGFGTIVSMLTFGEERELELSDEQGIATRLGLRFIRLPVEDRATPQLHAALSTVAQIAGEIGAGRNVAAHCRQGIGRSATIVAAVLVALGASVEDAWSSVQLARGRPVPDTEQQRLWLGDYEAALKRQRR